jgi:hypothetical protein
MRRLAAALVIAFSVVGACVGGCGAGGEGGTASVDSTPNWKRPNGLVYVTPGLTRERFRAHLNKYCRRKWRVIQDVPASYFGSLGFYIYGAIQGFGTAPGERGTVEHLLFQMKDGMRQGERTGIAAPAQVEALFAGYNQTARRLGLDECLVAGAHLPRREARSN